MKIVLEMLFNIQRSQSYAFALPAEGRLLIRSRYRHSIANSRLRRRKSSNRHAER